METLNRISIIPAPIFLTFSYFGTRYSEHINTNL